MVADFVAGAIGFTYVWDPSAGQTGNISTLTGLSVTMVVTNSANSFRKTFQMTVASNGLTASYTTAESTDFPYGGIYAISFQVSNNTSLIMETPPVLRTIAAPL